MMNALIGLGLGIVIFALIVGVGVVVLQNFGDAVATCSGAVGTWYYNATAQKCSNGTFAVNKDPADTGWNTQQTMIGYLSSNLITWVPAIIALGVGLLFIGALMNRQGGKY